VARVEDDAAGARPLHDADRAVQRTVPRTKSYRAVK
jgi:hypothetical protein